MTRSAAATRTTLRHLQGWIRNTNWLFALMLALWLPRVVLAANQGPLAPIRVGAVSSVTGPVPFGQATDAAKAYFDKINARGGVNGRKIELVVMDDAFDAGRARDAASQLIDDPKVIGLVGGASAVDCSTNAKRYERADLMALLGTGVEGECFRSSHLVPLNTGPVQTLFNALEFARTTLRSRQICVLTVDINSVGMAEVLTEWEAKTSHRLTYSASFGPASDMRDLLQRLLSAKCGVVVHSGLEHQVVEWVQMVQKHPGAKGLTTVFLTPAYTERVAQALGSPTVPVYCMTEFEPWSSRSAGLVDWRETLRQAKLPRSSFSQGGYSAAQLFVRVASGIEGEITRKNFAAAVRSVREARLPMLGGSFTVGPGNGHNPNKSNLVMKLESGAWRIATPFWMEAP